MARTVSDDAPTSIATLPTSIKPPSIVAQQEIKIPTDPKVPGWVQKGKILCNLVQYHQYMTKNPDGISDVNARRNKGLASGQFEGGSGSQYPGGLVWAGGDFNFVDLGNVT